VGLSNRRTLTSNPLRSLEAWPHPWNLRPWRKGASEETIFDICLWLACRGSFADAAGRRDRGHSGRIRQNCDRAYVRLTGLGRTRNCRWVAAHRWLVDAGVGGGGVGPCDFEYSFTVCGFVGQYLAGRYGSGLGIAGTGLLVCGCAAVWMEANRCSPSRGLVENPSGEEGHERRSETHPSLNR
jgi:hypothetical protein